MWICRNCKEENEETFDVCWNCGTSREGEQPENIEEFHKIKSKLIDEKLKREAEISDVLETIRRPKIVTVFSWMLIIGSILQSVILLLVLIYVNFNINRFGSSISFAVISILINIIVGLGMREGENWARLLYLWLRPASIIYGYLSPKVGNFAPIFWTIVYIIILMVLTRPNIILFFKQKNGVLPNTLTCPLCDKEIDLNINERLNKKFICPNCNEHIDFRDNKFSKSLF